MHGAQAMQQQLKEQHQRLDRDLADLKSFITAETRIILEKGLTPDAEHLSLPPEALKQLNELHSIADAAGSANNKKVGAPPWRMLRACLHACMRFSSGATAFTARASLCHHAPAAQRV